MLFQQKITDNNLENNNVKFDYWGSTDKFSKNNTLANRLINVDFNKAEKVILYLLNLS